MFVCDIETYPIIFVFYCESTAHHFTVYDNFEMFIHFLIIINFIWLVKRALFKFVFRKYPQIYYNNSGYYILARPLYD